MTTRYNTSFANLYNRYYLNWIRAFAPPLVTYLAGLPAPQQSLLDLCCGTGEQALAFCDAGWKVIGLDFSPGMLSVAKEKLASRMAEGKITLLQADATHFTLPKQVGVCVCVDGALNHLESCSLLAECFTQVSAALVQQGQFVFDLLQPAHFRRWHNTTVLDEPEALIVRHGIWDDEANFGMLRISAAIREGSVSQRVEQTMRVRTFTRAEVVAALESAGLTPADCHIQAIDSPSRVFYRATRR